MSRHLAYLFVVLCSFSTYAAKVNIAVLSVATLKASKAVSSDEPQEISEFVCKVPIFKTAFEYLNNKALLLYQGVLAANQETTEALLRGFVAKANKEAMDIADGKMVWSTHQTLERELSIANQLIARQVVPAKDVEVFHLAWEPKLLGFLNYNRANAKEKEKNNKENSEEYRDDKAFQDELTAFINDSKYKTESKKVLRLIVDVNFPLYLEDTYQTIFNSSPKLSSSDNVRVRELAKTSHKLNRDIFKALAIQNSSDTIFVISAQKALPVGHDLTETDFIDTWLSDLTKGGDLPGNVVVVAELSVDQIKDVTDGKESWAKAGQLALSSNYSSDFVSVAAPSTFILTSNKGNHSWTLNHSGVAKSIVAAKLALVAQGMKAPTRDEVLAKFYDECISVPQMENRIKKGRVYLPNFGQETSKTKAVDHFVPRKQGN